MILSLIPFLSSGCSRDPNASKHRHFQNGLQDVERGKLDDATIEFRNAIEIDPAYGEAHYQLGLVYLHREQWSRANQELARAVDLQPANHAARIELARLLIAAGDLKQVQEQIDWLLKQRSSDAQTHVLDAEFLAAQGQFTAALQEAQKATVLDPASGDAYLKFGLMQLKSNLTGAAESSFKKAIELDPAAVAPRLMLANYYRVRGRFPESEEQLRESIQRTPGHPEPTAALARLY